MDYVAVYIAGAMAFGAAVMTRRGRASRWDREEATLVRGSRNGGALPSVWCKARRRCAPRGVGVGPICQRPFSGFRAHLLLPRLFHAPTASRSLATCGAGELSRQHVGARARGARPPGERRPVRGVRSLYRGRHDLRRDPCTTIGFAPHGSEQPTTQRSWGSSSPSDGGLVGRALTHQRPDLRSAGRLRRRSRPPRDAGRRRVLVAPIASAIEQLGRRVRGPPPRLALSRMTISRARAARPLGRRGPRSRAPRRRTPRTRAAGADRRLREPSRG